mgnify:CR=1 FL=1
MNVQIRIMNENDAVEVAKISILSFSSPWSTESYIQEIKNPVALYLVAVINNNIVGFIGTWNVLDESHITNVAVHPDFRKQKIGSLLFPISEQNIFPIVQILKIKEMISFFIKFIFSRL